MLELESVASHIRPVESTSMVAVSLLDSEIEVAVVRCDQRTYVCCARWY
jgi:hypothetical protein